MNRAYAEMCFFNFSSILVFAVFIIFIYYNIKNNIDNLGVEFCFEVALFICAYSTCAILMMLRIQRIEKRTAKKEEKISTRKRFRTRRRNKFIKV